MKHLFECKGFQWVCAVLSFCFAVLGDPCAGQESVPAVRGIISSQVIGKEPFQPVLKGPTQQESDQKMAEYLFIRGRVLEAEKRERQALQCYERACQYVSSDAILTCLVSLAIQQKRYDEALCYFDKITNTDVLGISTLDTLSTVCARLGDTERVVKVFRAILRAIPLNDSGPLRMLVHDRLGWSEYSEGNYDDALVSLKAVRTMLKKPERYGIDAEGVALFEATRSLNLCLLLDIYVMQKKPELAQEILQEWRSFQEETFQKNDENLSEEELKEEREAFERQSLFEEARVAYVAEDVSRAFALVLKAYEIGYEEPEPYKLLETILETQGKSAEFIGILERLAQKQPHNETLKRRLLVEYLKAQNNTDTWQKALKLLAELTQYGDCTEFQIARLFMTMQDEKPAEFLATTDVLLAEMPDSEVVETVWKGVCNFRTEISLQKSDSDEDGKGDEGEENNEICGQSNSENKDTPRENVEDWFISPEARLFAEKIVEFVRDEYLINDKSEGSLSRFWFASVLARELGCEEDAMAFYSAAMERFEALKSHLPEREHAILEPFLTDWGAYFADEKHDNASMVETFARGYAVFSDSVTLKMAYIRALLMSGELEKAKLLIRQLREQNPDDLEFALLSAQWLQQSQQLEEAKEQFQTILGEFEDDYSAEFNRSAIALIRCQYSALEDMCGNAENAEEQLRLALDEFPDNVAVKNTLAYLWACQNKNLQRALQYSKETLEEEPNDAAYLDTVGWIYYRLGDYEKATKNLSRAAELMEDATVFSHLGDVSLALNQKEKALEYFNRSIKLFYELRQMRQIFNSEDLKHAENQLNSLKNL